MHVGMMYANLTALASANTRPVDRLGRYLRFEYGANAPRSILDETPRRGARRGWLRRLHRQAAQGFSPANGSPVG